VRTRDFRTLWLTTKNTVATIIKTLPDEQIGREVFVYFGDSNTTVDFTGTNLIGNNGVDWSPIEGNWMTCRFDGKNWLCETGASGSGGGLWADAGSYIYPVSGTNYRILDSTTALTSALLDLENTTWILTPGTYNISSGIVIAKDRVSIQASPGVIIKKTADIDAITISGDYCNILRVEIDGNGQGSSGIWITGAYNEVTGCISHDNVGHGIGLDGQSTDCWGNIVTGNTSYTNGGIGISQNTTTDNTIDDNHIYDNALEGITIDVTSHGCVCSDNRLVANGVTNAHASAGGVGGIGIDNVDFIKVTGNVITNHGTNAGIAIQNNIGISSNSVISGNVIDNPDTDGIVFINNSYASSGFSITGNTVTNAGNGAVSGWGIRLGANGANYTTRCAVTGNVVRGGLDGSIALDANCDNNNVIGNQVNGDAVVDNGTNNLVAWNDSASVSAAGWTDDGGVVRLTTATDDVAIGTADVTGFKLTVHEDAAAVVLYVSTDATANCVLGFSSDDDGTPRAGRIGIDYSDSVLRINYGASFDGVNNGLEINSAGGEIGGN
ncbi:hypothetical protein LCGC14_2233570, partial [marine sediment metagenome]